MIAQFGKMHAILSRQALFRPRFHAARAAHCVLPRPIQRLLFLGNAHLHGLHGIQILGAGAAVAYFGFQRFGCADDQNACVGQRLFDELDVVAPCLLGFAHIQFFVKGFVGAVGKDNQIGLGLR